MPYLLIFLINATSERRNDAASIPKMYFRITKYLGNRGYLPWSHTPSSCEGGCEPLWDTEPVSVAAYRLLSFFGPQVPSGSVCAGFVPVVRSLSIMWLMYSGDFVLRATKAYTTGTTYSVNNNENVTP